MKIELNVNNAQKNVIVALIKLCLIVYYVMNHEAIHLNVINALVGLVILYPHKSISVNCVIRDAFNVLVNMNVW